jgi:restriction endonuclease S subunit
MKQERLEHLFDFQPKSKIKAGDGLEDGLYPFYTSSENQSKYLNEFQHGPGCLVFGTGGKASVHLTTSPFATSTDCITIKPKPNVGIDVGYVFQYFKGNMQVLENGFKGAGLQHISKRYLSDIQIPHPEEVTDQIRISHLLSKVEGLIAQRKQHLKQLKELRRSLFLEMFGPRSAGYGDWPLVEINDLTAKHKGAMRTGPFGSNLLHSEFTTDGDVAVLGIDNVVNNFFAWNERRFITLEKYKKLENYRIFPGDVIVTIMGTIGRSAVVPDDIPLAVNTKHLAAITPNQDLTNSVFLSYSIHSSPFILNQFKSKNRGAIMSGLNLRIIKETKLKLPPIHLQNKFAKTHTRVDELKAIYQQSLAELETLYGSLSQLAFKGKMNVASVPISKSQQVVATAGQEKKRIEKKLTNRAAESGEPFNSLVFEDFLRARAGMVYSTQSLWEELKQASYENSPSTFETFKKLTFRYLERGGWFEQVYESDEANYQKNDEGRRVCLRIRNDS